MTKRARAQKEPQANKRASNEKKPISRKRCALSGARISPNGALHDNHHVIPRAEGGEYSRENIVPVDPVAHMIAHGTFKQRREQLDEIKSLYDARAQLIALAVSQGNRALALERRTDSSHPDIEHFLKEQEAPVKKKIAEIERKLEKAIKAYPDQLVALALKIPGIGPMTVIALTVYIDLAKADTRSALSKYCGYDKPAHERYVKGKAGGGNKTLRSALYCAVCSIIKLGRGSSGYNDLYYTTKDRLANSEKITKTRNGRGQLIESKWRDVSDGHRHAAAIRVVAKRFLGDYWHVGRELLGLSVPPPYVESQLGHKHIQHPSEMGWDWPRRKIREEAA